MANREIHAQVHAFERFLALSDVQLSEDQRQFLILCMELVDIAAQRDAINKAQSCISK